MTYTITISDDDEKDVTYTDVKDTSTDAIRAILDNEVCCEESEAIIEIAENGVDNGCEEICSIVDDMLSEAGFETEDHEQMIDELEHLSLVEKEE